MVPRLLGPLPQESACTQHTSGRCSKDGWRILSIPQPMARSVLHGKHKSTCHLTVSRLRIGKGTAMNP